MPLYSLIGILLHSALTATVYAYRAAVHLHAIDEKKSPDASVTEISGIYRGKTLNCQLEKLIVSRG